MNSNGCFLRLAVEKSVLSGHARFKHDEASSRSCGNITLVFFITRENVAHNSEALRVGEHFA